MVTPNQGEIIMHVSNLKRSVPHSPTHLPEVRHPSERGPTIAIILLGLVLLGIALWFSQHGVSFLPCGENVSAACG